MNMIEDTTYDYFISYRRKTGGYDSAQTIKEILERNCKTAFVDKNELQIGKYPQQLVRAIQSSRASILILNEDSWREKININDMYYQEIICMVKDQKNILPIEYANGLLNNVPVILSEELKKYNCDLSKFEKITKIQNPFYNFEEELCQKLGIGNHIKQSIKEEIDTWKFDVSIPDKQYYSAEYHSKIKTDDYKNPRFKAVLFLLEICSKAYKSYNISETSDRLYIDDKEILLFRQERGGIFKAIYDKLERMINQLYRNRDFTNFRNDIVKLVDCLIK